MHLDVVHGQTLDLLGDADAEEVARHKTASYTTAGPLAAGGVLGGASADEIGLLADIGFPLGVAFQLRDDILGAFGRSEATGKPVGTDLKLGKRTYLLQEALRLAGPQDRAAVEAVIGVRDADDGAVIAAQRAIEATGAREHCEGRIDDLLEQALSRLDSFAFLDEGKRALEHIARLVVRREA